MLSYDDFLRVFVIMMVLWFALLAIITVLNHRSVGQLVKALQDMRGDTRFTDTVEAALQNASGTVKMIADLAAGAVKLLADSYPSSAGVGLDDFIKEASKLLETVTDGKPNVPDSAPAEPSPKADEPPTAAPPEVYRL